jgi:thioredoxin 1
MQKFFGVFVTSFFEDMSPKYDGKAKICKLNIDDHGDLARKYQVMSIPTLLLIKDGETIERISGALPQEVLEEKLNNLL